MIPGALLALLGIGAGLVLARGADHEQGPSDGGMPAPNPGPSPVPAPSPAEWAAMSCDQALNRLGESGLSEASLAATVSLALAKGTDPASLEKLAAQLESGASAPGVTPTQSAALRKLAACCRDRAAALRTAAKFDGSPLSPSPGYTSPPAASPPAASPPASYTASPPPSESAPAPAAQPTAVVVDMVAAPRSGPAFTYGGGK